MQLSSIWKYDYRLDKMNLSELWVAFFQYYAVQAYVILAVVSGYFTLQWAESFAPIAVTAAVITILYPFVWYLLHRFVLHGKYLYKSKLTAKVWKRIHFDHHRDPHDLKVLFGALYTTLPTIMIVVLPVGYLIDGKAGAAAGLCTGLVVTCVYEFTHCIQHLRYAPEWSFFKRIKRLHLQHHFHNENHNFGIMSFGPDKWFKSYNEEPKDSPKSETVFNLGYTKGEVAQYPWVARYTPDLDEIKAANEGVERRKLPEAS